MLHSSSFHLRKGQNITRGYHARKLTSRRRFDGASRVKLTDIFKSLRRLRLRKGVSQRPSLTHSQSLPPPLADHSSPPQRLDPLPDLFTSSSVRYRSDADSILSATEEDYSSGMSTSSSDLGGNLPDMESGHHIPPRLTFPTSSSVFRLRSSSTKDYLVDRLEQHLCQLSLGDGSPDTVHKSLSSRDIPMDVCLDVSFPRTIDPETSSRRALSDKDAQKPTQLSYDQNVVPMILITSVDAKHTKPLPPSSKRPSRTPFAPSNVIYHPTNPNSAKFKANILSDDPFTMQPHSPACPPDYSLSFRLPPFPLRYPTPSKYAPETPTPMCCDHFGDCRGDLWEVLHPPLVAGSFTLPPFELPPLSTGLFGDMSTPLPR